MQQYFLMGKDGKIPFQLPESWTVLKNAVLTPTKTDKNIYDMVGEALNNPVGTAPLKDLVKPNHKIAVIVDDFARPTPKQDILAALTDYLRQCGVAYDQLDIVFSLGTHRGLTEEEVDRALGDKLKGKVRWTNHNAWADDLVPIGSLKSAGEVKINPLVAGADFRITVGSILAHPMNGFGGGAKSIFPGVSNFDAIRDHHIALMIARDASFGNTKGNPFREEVCGAARLARLDFIINAI
ncbi:MAG: DUF2088 domain-containing protein, partial [Deltaproteobacteria bacterium]|nr:DUF2088 domain-containing protein [Deltaproteobacteria bacterium]